MVGRHDRPHSCSLPFTHPLSHPITLLSLFLTVLLSILLFAGWVNAKEKPKPNAQEWQIRGIEAALEDERSGVKNLALQRLTQYEPKTVQQLAKPETVRTIGDLLKDDKQDADVRSNAAEALSNFGEAAKSYIPNIGDILKDDKQSPYIRGSAIVALSNFGEAAKSYIPNIGDILKDDKQDADVRGSAAYALGNFGEAAKSYIPDILNFIKDDKQGSDVRGSATVALSSFGEAAKSYIPDIGNLLKDGKQSPSIRGSAAEALSNFGEAAKSYIPDIGNLLKDDNQTSYVRVRAAYALGSFGEAARSYIPDILNFIKDDKQDSDVRASATVALSSFGETAKSYIPDIGNLLKDGKQSPSIRGSAAAALSNFGEAAKSYIPDIGNLLKDDNQTSYVRGSAAAALGNFGEAAKSYIPDILNFIKDAKQASDVRGSAAGALSNLEPLSLDRVVTVLSPVYEDRADVDSWRFHTYFLSNGDEHVKRLLKWVGRPKQLPDQLSYDEGVKTLEAFKRTWEVSKGFPALRDDLADKIALVSRKVSWQTKDIPLLRQHYDNLKSVGSNNADSVQAAIIALEGWQWFFNARNTILTHIAFWVALIFAYPKSAQIQAIFFWNPWVRTIIGLGYVSSLLAWVPFLRQKLFAPFKDSLLADAGLDHFNPQAYFPESEVKGAGGVNSIAEVLPTIKGQLVLEGDSGLGKSMFLRHLVKTSKRIVVYLPAQKCDRGVIEAIQAKLHGQAQDAEFLKNLIYSGAIDICIDGLNEVTADTRAKITQFVESYFKGNIIMTTQPIEWVPPSTAKIYQLQPLRRDQIEQFLLSRYNSLPPIPPAPPLKREEINSLPPFLRGVGGIEAVTTQSATYQQTCLTYLAEALNDRQPPEELAAAQRILSNPMDLSIVAQMIAVGKTPDLFRLQEQQYQQMSDEYQQMWKQAFPLKQFSGAVYQMRLNDQKALPSEEFYNELLCMEDEKFKMVVSRQWQNAKGEAQKEWYFRHDKIAEFFIVQTFLGSDATVEERLKTHMNDPRFRGVYFLLATLLPLDAAQHLREDLIQYAADTKDHTVSDTFVQLLRSRT